MDLAFSFMPHSDHTSTDLLIVPFSRSQQDRNLLLGYHQQTRENKNTSEIHVVRFGNHFRDHIFCSRSEGHSTVHQCPDRGYSTAFPSTESQHNREQSHGGRFRSVFQRYLSVLIFRLVGGYAHNEVSKRCSPPILRCGQESRYKRGQEFAWNYAIVFQFIGEL